MSEEIVYANLKFQDSDRKENIQELDICGPKESPAPSRLRHKTVLALSLLCLLLLIGLGVVGGVFYATLWTQRVELTRLQNSEEELLRNVSLQLMHNSHSSVEIGKLSSSLQRLATALCQELCAKDPEHKCNPCPKSSAWYKESCYSQLNGFHTWKSSELLCSAQNASLLKIKDKSTLQAQSFGSDIKVFDPFGLNSCAWREKRIYFHPSTDTYPVFPAPFVEEAVFSPEFIKSKKLYDYWLGLSPSYNYIAHMIIDENIFSSEWFKGDVGDLSRMYCGYVNGNYISYAYCSQTKSVLCVKTANEVKVTNVLMSNSPEGSM